MHMIASLSNKTDAHDMHLSLKSHIAWFIKELRTKRKLKINAVSLGEKSQPIGLLTRKNNY